MEETLDFTKICRVCLSNKNTVVSVFKRNVSKKLMACAAVQVWAKDGLPAQICKLCATKLHTSYSFKQQCERSDAKLRLAVNINKRFEQTEQELVECVEENQEILNDSTSGFVFVDCDPLGEVNSGETVISEYSFSITEPPPLVPIVNTVRLTGPLKIEDHIISSSTEDRLFESNRNQTVSTFVPEVPITPNVKKMRKEVSTCAFTGLLNLPNCGSERLKFSPIENETHIQSYKQSNKNQLEAKLTSFNTKKVALNTVKIEEYTNNDACDRIYSSELYKCNTCDKTFSDNNRYKSHLSSHKKLFFCSACDEVCQTDEKLQKHMNIHRVFTRQENRHSNEADNVCHICTKLFSNSSCLEDHIKDHIQELHCQASDELFTDCKEEEERSVGQLNGKPFKCTVCGKAFAGIKYLNIHVKKYCPGVAKSNLSDSNIKISRNRKKKEERSLVVSSPTLTRNKNKKEHILKTVQNKRSVKSANPVPSQIFQCHLCDKQVLTEQNLLNHRKEHNKELDFRCPVCDKPFITTADLKDHCAIHAQDKPLGCSKCDKRFSTQNNLIKHEKTHLK